MVSLGLKAVEWTMGEEGEAVTSTRKVGLCLLSRAHVCDHLMGTPEGAG